MIMNVFSDIFSRNLLADFLGVKRSTLTYLLYKKETKNCYSVFTIAKKSGGCREICSPSNDLKMIQRKLASALWAHQKSILESQNKHPNISHAYEKKKNIITNASIHKNKRFVLNFDLEDFFGSFHFGRVKGFFEKNRNFLLPSNVATVIAQIACYSGSLPQGAPSSPIITNLIFQIADMRLLKVAKKYKMDYTRYADDLTFSTNRSAFINEFSAFMEQLHHELSRAGFRMNEKKTRLIYRDSRQDVTGITVNKKLGIRSDFVRATRAMAHRLYTQGRFEIDGKSGTIDMLEGRFAFIDQLDHYNNKFDGMRHNHRELNGREKQYQAFLFFKYFFSNKKPLIVTEGKTDARYLKAALKSLHQEYPMLIEKLGENQFKFKISFLKKTKRLKYFLDIELDGASAMKSIRNYYTGANNLPNLFRKFQKLSNGSPLNPVILLFDNELQTEKPLKDFLCGDHYKNSRAEIKSDSHSLLIPNSKLYVVVPPLPSNLIECEIEDLFTRDVLERKIGGKIFCRDKGFDKEKHYSKEVFSKYILANYQTLDFYGFKPLLDVLSNIVASQVDNSSQQES